MMRVAPLAEKGRDQKRMPSPPGAPWGHFWINGPCGRLFVIASCGEPGVCDWEHVSVSRKHGLPVWTEMAFVKNLFWEPGDCVVQFHPPADRYINNSEVLHLWRYTGEMPMPPTWTVGVGAEKVRNVAHARELQAQGNAQAAAARKAAQR